MELRLERFLVAVSDVIFFKDFDAEHCSTIINEIHRISKELDENCGGGVSRVADKKLWIVSASFGEFDLDIVRIGYLIATDDSFVDEILKYLESEEFFVPLPGAYLSLAMRLAIEGQIIKAAQVKESAVHYKLAVLKKKYEVGAGAIAERAKEQIKAQGKGGIGP
jgi:hypothetical protein